jgi:hypothetical protein
MAAGIHYFRDGKPYRGEIHKHKDGTIMTGKTMSKSSKKVFHFKDLSDRAKQKAKNKKQGK